MQQKYLIMCKKVKMITLQIGWLPLSLIYIPPLSLLSLSLSHTHTHTLSPSFSRYLYFSLSLSPRHAGTLTLLSLLKVLYFFLTSSIGTVVFYLIVKVGKVLLYLKMKCTVFSNVSTLKDSFCISLSAAAGLNLRVLYVSGR